MTPAQRALILAAFHAAGAVAGALAVAVSIARGDHWMWIVGMMAGAGVNACCARFWWWSGVTRLGAEAAGVLNRCRKEDVGQ